jgi:glucose/arabinose dehydrogenase
VKAAISAAVLLLSATAAAGPSNTSVNVTLSDFAIHLSTGTVAPGRVSFHVLNRGNVQHSFTIAGIRTGALRHGQRSTITVPLAKPGSFRFSSDLPGQARLGMTGLLHVRSAAGKRVALATKSALTLTPVLTGLPPLTFAVSPPGDLHRLLVTQQNGLVLLLKDGKLQAQPFADLRSVVHADGEQGLLSLAFAPDYTTSGLLYAYYNNRNGNIRVVELHRSNLDPDQIDNSRRRILAITKVTADHNGGMMQFGPDGDLYIAVGDGGANPPTVPVGIDGQTLGDLFGSILRIDPRTRTGAAPYAVPANNPFVSTSGARPEIVAYGLRNPWRFWIDAPTKTMWIGDVGEGSREEIDQLPLTRLGLDFGWPCKEGDVTPPKVALPASCATTPLTAPIYYYPHSKTRCSIIGGVLDRDTSTQALAGLYLWTDLCDGQIYGLAGNREVPLNIHESQPSSFGTDAAGHVYLVTATGGLYRLTINSVAN